MIQGFNEAYLLLNDDWKLSNYKAPSPPHIPIKLHLGNTVFNELVGQGREKKKTYSGNNSNA